MICHVTIPEAVTLLGMALVLAAVVLATVAEGHRPSGRIGTPVQLVLLFTGLLLAIGGFYAFVAQFS